LKDLVGYTIVSATSVTGTFEGADYDRVVRLDNGWIFQFRTYGYHYAYHPDAVVFAKEVTAADFTKYGLKPPPVLPLLTYKLLIDDEVYDVSRVR
jgi:hypothetical protein